MLPVLFLAFLCRLSNVSTTTVVAINTFQSAWSPEGSGEEVIIDGEVESETRHSHLGNSTNSTLEADEGRLIKFSTKLF